MARWLLMCMSAALMSHSHAYFNSGRLLVGERPYLYMKPWDSAKAAGQFDEVSFSLPLFRASATWEGNTTDEKISYTANCSEDGRSIRVTYNADFLPDYFLVEGDMVRVLDEEGMLTYTGGTSSWSVNSKLAYIQQRPVFKLSDKDVRISFGAKQDMPQYSLLEFKSVNIPYGKSVWISNNPSDSPTEFDLLWYGYGESTNLLFRVEVRAGNVGTLTLNLRGRDVGAGDYFDITIPNRWIASREVLASSTFRASSYGSSWFDGVGVELVTSTTTTTTTTEGGAPGCLWINKELAHELNARQCR